MNSTRSVMLAAVLLLCVAVPGATAPVCSDLLVGVNERCPLWSAAYNHAGGRGGDGEDIGRAVAVTPDGSKVFVTGQSRDDTTLQDQATAAYNAVTGTRLWSARHDHEQQFDTGSAIAASNTAVFVTGRSIGEGFDWATSAYDATTGAVLWHRRVAGDSGLDDTSWSVVAAPDGRTVYVTGDVDDGADVAGDALTIAYDVATGDVVWKSRYDAGSYDGGFRLAMAPDGGRLFMLGTTRRDQTGNDLLVVAYHTGPGAMAGEQVWEARYDSVKGVERPIAIALSPDGARVVVTGTADSAGTGTDIATVVLDAATGAREWAATYNGSRNANDAAAGVAVVGNRVVTAGTAGEGNVGFDAFTRAYDLATGAVAWTRVENMLATFNDTPLAMTSWGGKVYVVGFYNVPRGEIQPFFKVEPAAMVTAAYDVASGTRSWVAQHTESGVGADVGVGIAAGPNGVYPAGTFVFSGTYVYPVVAAKPYAYDIGVVAYRH